MVCYYHVTYAFQSKFTLQSWLNVKELLAQNKRNIRSLSDSNWIRTCNHLVSKRTLNCLAKLAKWFSCVVALICTVLQTVYYYHVTYTFRANLHYIVVCERSDKSSDKTSHHSSTLSLVLKGLSVRLLVKWLWVRIQLLSLFSVCYNFLTSNF